MTLDEFKRFADWGSEMAWYRYNYVGIKPPLMDKTGQIVGFFEEKATVPEEKRKEFIGKQLDYYINQVYRSLKCFRDGQISGARLEAAESIMPLLDMVFALHGRLRPYYKYYDWELKNRPLDKLNITGDEFTKSVLLILESGDANIQRQILEEMERITRSDGYGEIWDSWGEKIGWMKNFVS